MAPPDLEREIDTLYQLPLDEFTSARNALARTAGTDGASVKGLQKPPIAAWAVNQLYWNRRDVYDTLIEAAETLRASHKAVLAGKSADLRAAGKDHEAALEAALKASIGLLQESGHPATDATRQAIVTTLRALPAGHPPGRLTQVLQPGGFEALAGVPLGARAPAREARKPARARKDEPADGEAQARADARDAAAAAARELKIAEQAARREEFEAARAARDAEKAERALETARAELDSAERAVKDAERQAAAAADHRTGAEARARDADAAVKKARARVTDAEARIKRLR